MGLVSSVENSLGIGSGPSSASNGFTQIFQEYRTESVANTQLALYTFAVRSPHPPHPIASGGLFTFPISPQTVRKSYTAMTNIYDVQGTISRGGGTGVNRIVDQYGNSPVMFNIEGTTGWKRHSNDDFKRTGLQSIQVLGTYLNQFARYNQFQMNNNKELYIMEFYDYFSSEYWEVVPIGEQEIRLDASRPLWTYYNLKLAGIKRVSAPPTPEAPNPIDQMFSIASSNVMNAVTGFIGEVGSAYQELAGVATTLGGIL